MKMSTGVGTIESSLAKDDQRLQRIAQVFTPLPNALRGLDEYYGKLEKQTKLVDRVLCPRFYPHCTTFLDFASKTTQEFSYIKPLTESAKSPFLVKIKSSDEIAMVKPVARYGAGAHQLLADSQTTSRLRFCGSIDGQDDIRITTKGIHSLYLGPLRMVIMDYTDGTHGEATKAKNKPPDARAQIEVMVIKLRESDQVFGDLRPSNVVFSDGKAYLVDFDWAGKHGEAFYPTELGTGTTDRCKGRDLGVIEKEHDFDLRNHYSRQSLIRELES